MIIKDGKNMVAIRTECKGTYCNVFKVVGVAVPASLQILSKWLFIVKEQPCSAEARKISMTFRLQGRGD